MQKKKDEDIFIKAVLSCSSCGVQGHKFDLKIGFHQTRETDILVLKKAKEEHGAIMPGCTGKNLTFRKVDSGCVGLHS